MAFDLVVKNGMIVDGSGLPSYRADIAAITRQSGSIDDHAVLDDEVECHGSPPLLEGTPAMRIAQSLASAWQAS